MKSPMIWLFSGEKSEDKTIKKHLFNYNKIFRETIIYGEALIKQYSNLSDNYLEPSKISKKNHLKNPITSILLTEIAIGKMLKAEKLLPKLIIGINNGKISSAVTANLLSMESALFFSIEADKTRQLIKKNNLNSTKYNSKENPIIEHFYEIESVKSTLSEKDTSFKSLIHNLTHLHTLLKENELMCSIFSIPVLKKNNYNLLNKIKHLFNVKEDTKIKQLLQSNHHLTYIIKSLESIGNWTYINCSASEIISNTIKYNLKFHNKSTCLSLLSPFEKFIYNLETLKNKMNKYSS